MRHYFYRQLLARTPAPGTQSVLEAPRAPTLVASRGVALQSLAGRRRAPIGAIQLAPVALAAHQHLHMAARAQEESGGLVVHRHPWQYRRCAGRDRPPVQQSSRTRSMTR